MSSSPGSRPRSHSDQDAGWPTLTPTRTDDSHVVVTGDIDILTAPELDRRLREHLNAQPAGGSLLVDLSRVRHFSAAGLHVLERAAITSRARQVRFSLGPVPRQVGRILDLCQSDLLRRPTAGEDRERRDVP